MPHSSPIGSVLSLWRYPISSLAGEPLGTVMARPSGVEKDRTHGLFDAQTHQVIFPSREKIWNRAPLVAARLRNGSELELSVAEGRWLPPDDPALHQELKAHFGREVRVARYGDRIADTEAASRYAHSPIHLLSRQSLDRLRRLLPDSIIDERRFRPNILIDLPEGDGSTPELQLLGRQFRIGDVLLKGTRDCGRCSFTTFEQAGLPEDKDVLRALIRDFEKNFGIYCDVLEEGEISVGDPVVVDFEMLSAPIVIVGAGQAGAVTARALRELGATAPIELYGDERHPPYERPPLSKERLTQEPEAKALTRVLPAEDAERLGIDLHLGTRVVAIDRSRKAVETDDGRVHPYSRLVLATGGSARRIPALGRGHGRVHSVRTVEDAEYLRRQLRAGSKIFVLGGGWLGLEIAAAARQIGCEVTLFAKGTRLCPRTLPTVVSDFVAKLHLVNGVRLRFGEELEFKEHGDRIEAKGTSGIESADLLVVAIGMTANDLLARKAGLPCADGIITDEDGATEDPDVFAVGDVARQLTERHPEGIRIESWHNANEQPYRAARALLSIPRTAAPPVQFWSSQYGRMLQIVGMPDPDAMPVVTDDGDSPFWEFDGFAIGVDRQREIRRFAAGLTDESCIRAQLATTEAPEPRSRADLKRVALCSAASVPEGQIHRTHVDEVGAITVARQDGRFFAFQDTCPHADASLSEGFLEAGRIVCPLHFAEFDMVSGTPFNAPAGCPRLRCYEVEIDDDEIYAFV